MKKALALILVVVTLFSLAACAQKAASEGSSAASTAAASSAAKSTADSTSASTTASSSAKTTSSASGATISVATGYTDAKLELFQKIINDFTAESGINVELITPGNDYEAQMKTMMASNALPDVWMTHGWSLLRYSEYLKTVNDQPWFDTIDQTSLSGVMADKDGNFYALGMDMAVSGIVYNKDALDKAGVDPFSIKTWDDFNAACDKILAAGITPLAIGGSVSGNRAGLLGSVAPTFWTDKGAKYDMAAALQDGSFDFDTYGTELYQFLAEWVKKGYINKDALTLDAAGAQQMLGSGEAAFMVRGLDNITVARQYYPDANLGCIPMPASAAGAPSFRVGEGDAWGVWKDTKNEEACWTLLAYLARPEVGTEWSAVSGCIPTVKGASSGDSYVVEAYQAAQAAYGTNLQYDNVFDRKYFPSGMWGVMGDSMSMLMESPDDVKSAVDYLKDNYQQLYAEAKNG